MSPTQPEAVLRNAIMDLLRFWQVKAWIHDSVGIFDPIRKIYRSRKGKHSVKGLPDIHGIIPGGRFFAIEVKNPPHKSAAGKWVRSYPSPEQRQQIEEINAAGGLAFVARSLKDLEERKYEFGVGRV